MAVEVITHKKITKFDIDDPNFKPLPNGEVTMDGESLKAEGREEKQLLMEEIKEFLESVSLSERARQEQEQADAQQSVLNKAPLPIYIG